MLDKLAKVPTILLVDDDADFIAGLSDRLIAEGFSLMTAYSGLDALSCLQISRPSVVLLDFHMPGMDGVETLQAIHRVDPKIPVIRDYSDRGRSPGTSAAAHAVRGSGVHSETGRFENASTDAHLCVGAVVCW